VRDPGGSALVEAAVHALLHGAPALWDSLRRDKRVPDLPGLYAVHCHNQVTISDLGRVLQVDLTPGLLYVGRSANLHARLLSNHFAGNAAGSTLRFTFGCVLLDALALEPCQNPGNNPRFTRESEERLTQWMRSHLLATFWIAPSLDALDRIERLVVRKLHPSLNDGEFGPSGCCATHVQLNAVRARVADKARARPCR
jgi:hypothetical protein